MVSINYLSLSEGYPGLGYRILCPHRVHTHLSEFVITGYQKRSAIFVLTDNPKVMIDPFEQETRRMPGAGEKNL